MNVSRIVLIGFMGTGKTAIGRCLARQFQADFLDTDAEIERMAGKSVPAIFAEGGEAAFRTWETGLLERLADSWTSPATSLVLATGGGMALRSENVTLLKRLGPVVWLTASAEDILRRVGPDLRQRPLLADYQFDPLSRIHALLAAREPHYAAAADLVWETSPFATPEEAANLLAQQLCLSADHPLRTSCRL